MTLDQSTQKITEMMFWLNHEAEAFKNMCESAFDFKSNAFSEAQARFKLARFRLSLLTEGANDSEETGQP